MNYIKSLVGTHYVWGKEIDKKSPFWYEDNPPPPINIIKRDGLNCAGLINLYLRAISITPLGGTVTYWNKFKKDTRPFNPLVYYKEGVIIGRRYRDENDQGHLALSIGNGNLMEAVPEVGVVICSIEISNRLAKNYFKLDKDYYEWVYFP